MKIIVTIDGNRLTVDEGKTILEAARLHDINIPTLCYLKDVNEIGACKMCVVEVEGKEHLVTSCNTRVKDGMVINTRSERVIKSRKQMLNLLLANHDVRCFPAPRREAAHFRICPTNTASRGPNMKGTMP